MNNQMQHTQNGEFLELLEFIQKWIDYKSNGLEDISDKYFAPKQLLLNGRDEGRINGFRLEIKKKMVKDFDGAIETVKQTIDSSNRIFDDLVILQRKYHRINNQSTIGTLDFDKAELEFTRMDNTLMYILNNLMDEDLV